MGFITFNNRSYIWTERMSSDNCFRKVQSEDILLLQTFSDQTSQDINQHLHKFNSLNNCNLHCHRSYCKQLSLSDLSLQGSNHQALKHFNHHNSSNNWSLINHSLLQDKEMSNQEYQVTDQDQKAIKISDHKDSSKLLITAATITKWMVILCCLVNNYLQSMRISRKTSSLNPYQQKENLPLYHMSSLTIWILASISQPNILVKHAKEKRCFLIFFIFFLFHFYSQINPILLF